MSEYQLELKQIVDYPRCRIYRQFIGLLMKDKNIRVGGTSRLYHFTVLSCFANFRTSYKRIDGISYTIYPGEWLCRVSELTEWFRTRFQHQALAILRELQDRHLITYTLLGRGKLVKFKIKGWCKYNRVLEYNAPCQKDTGFFFLPISVANELVSAGRCSEMDAMLDLWINTVYNDTQVQGSEVGPVVYMRNGTGSPLIGYAELAQRWGVSKATAGRYLRKMQELGYLSMVAFPGTHGTAIYLKQYLSTMFQISDVMINNANGSKSGGLGGMAFNSSLGKGGGFANSVIGKIATGNISSTGSISGESAADSLMSYMGYTALGPDAEGVPSFSNVEIGGGHIFATETNDEHPEGIAMGMYHTDQYMPPEGEYTTVTAADGTSWYKQYATDTVERKPHKADDGSIVYEESLVKRLPKAPRRKDKI